MFQNFLGKFGSIKAVMERERHFVHKNRTDCGMKNVSYAEVEAASYYVRYALYAGTELVLLNAV